MKKYPYMKSSEAYAKMHNGEIPQGEIFRMEDNKRIVYGAFVNGTLVAFEGLLACTPDYWQSCIERLEFTLNTGWHNHGGASRFAISCLYCGRENPELSSDPCSCRSS